MKQDGGLRRTFVQHLSQKKFHCLPIETGFVSPGVPDLNYCKRGIEGWIEMKRAVRDRVKIRAAQVAWIEYRIDHGGRVFVAVVDGDRLSMFHGLSIRQLVDQKVSAVAHIAQWRGNWDWASIEQILLRWKPLVSA